MKHLLSILFVVLAVLLVSCDDPVSQGGDTKGSARLHISVNTFDFLPMSSRTDVRDVASRLSFALFRVGEEKSVVSKSQQADDGGFGTLDISAAPGKYILVTIAHSGSDNCTISSPAEVKFAGNKMTDTFSSCDTLDIAEGDQTATIMLRRRVAMVRLVLQETLPDEARQLKFYYTGGSSTLNPTTGYGCVNSRQTEILNVPAQAYTEANTAYDIYTLPHADSGTLKLTVSALDADGATLTDRTIQDIPVKVGQITQYSGRLFGSDGNGIKVSLEIGETAWTQADYTF
ncbi:MAG: FimB/Mfa2 family fimbrial subunit [Bacteroidaceae bacterium]|nr:FimB/Mfa2 family fimbrial subunit [Bacteroidaceae bacterium]